MYRSGCMSGRRTHHRVRLAHVTGGWRAWPTQLSVALLLVAAAALPASAVAASQKCAQLKGKHLKSGGRAVVVTQLLNKEQTEGHAERVAYVCASPNGRAWRAGSEISTETENPPRIKVVAGAGNWVALRYEGVVGESFGASESAIDSATGKSFQYWKDGGGMGENFGSLLEAVALNARGQVALVTGVEGKATSEGEPGPTITRKVISVEPNGKRKVLDSAPTASIPTASLKLVGSNVHWTDGSVERSAAL
jgi:hypothetical protein